MRVFYCDHIDVELPEGHRFPMAKYGLLRRRLLDEGIVRPDDLVPSGLAPISSILRVHDAEYVDAVLEGRLPRKAARAIGFPWSPRLVRRALASVEGTIRAAEAALRDGVAGNLAGGTHHAYRDRGAGFCVFNDIAVALRKLLDDGAIGSALVIDLDVHQGDGTASIFESEPRVFTCSLHGERNFPFRKAKSDLDVGLPDGTADEAYLEALEGALAACFERARPGRPDGPDLPDLIIYQAGVDGLATDRFGRLALTHEGLGRRDRIVIAEARRRGLPIALTLGGGYAEPIEHSVAAYAQTYRVAAALFEGAPGWAPRKAGEEV